MTELDHHGSFGVTEPVASEGDGSKLLRMPAVDTCRHCLIMPSDWWRECVPISLLAYLTTDIDDLGTKEAPGK